MVAGPGGGRGRDPAALPTERGLPTLYLRLNRGPARPFCGAFSLPIFSSRVGRCVNRNEGERASRLTIGTADGQVRRQRRRKRKQKEPGGPVSKAEVSQQVEATELAPQSAAQKAYAAGADGVLRCTVLAARGLQVPSLQAHVHLCDARSNA